MTLLALFVCVFFIGNIAWASENDLYIASPSTFDVNGFANWGAGTWPPSSVGEPLVPQSTDSGTLSLLNEFDPNRIQSTIQTLVNFGTRHTASTTNSTTRGIGAARQWLFQQMTELAKPSNGLIKVSIPCYEQAAAPGIPFPVQLCNVQAEITGAADPNRMYVYTGLSWSREEATLAPTLAP